MLGMKCWTHSECWELSVGLTVNAGKGMKCWTHSECWEGNEVLDSQ